MANESLTAQQFYDLYKNQVQALAPEFTDFSDGALHDIIAGAFSVSMNELTELTIAEFLKTFFATAEGDDLEKLAKDHFGDTFGRPPAVRATGVIKFERPTTGAGNVTIPALTIVKTVIDEDGNAVSFQTDSEVILTGLDIETNITAIEADKGLKGNIQSGLLVVLESTLTDSTVTVTNLLAMAGGQDKQDDSEYRETIKSLILALAGATKAAIKGALLALPNIGFATPITEERVVIEYDIGLGAIKAGATFFRIPYPIVYVADELGNSSPALIAEAEEAISDIKACGVKVNVFGATPVNLDWIATLTLDSGGPNFTEFQNDLTKIKDSMTEYINDELGIGTDFSRSAANNFILDTWGPSGTGDLTAFSTSAPTGDVSVDVEEKIIAGTMSII